MKYAHEIKITVFSNPEDDENKIQKGLIKLVPFNLKDEKVSLISKAANGFNDKKIKVFAIILKREKHIKYFLKTFFENLNQNQINLLKRQKKSRTDKNLNFFIRLDKTKLLTNEFFITDSGSCFHVKISIAAYPARVKNALIVVDKILESS